MLRSLNETLGYELMAQDGGVGTVKDLFFSDEDWTIRYLVVDTGPWIFGRRILISPEALGQPVWASETFPVNLTREQVEESPDVDIAKPVSREYEEKLNNHYRWTHYWIMTPGASARPLYFPSNMFKTEKDSEGEGITSHLRSVNEILKYKLQARDGEVGTVADFIVDDEEWQTIYMVVDVADRLKPEKQVLVSLEWISNIEVSGHKITLDLTQDAIKYSPPFDPTLPVNRQYEEVIYDYYGKPKYWRQVVQEG